MKKLWALRYVAGGLLAFILVICSGLWALRNYPGQVGAAVLIVVVWAILNQPRVRRERERTENLVQAAWQEAYAPFSPPPELKRSSQYGYPAFEIKFRSKAEWEGATPMNEIFSSRIGEIFKNHGPRRRPFSAQQAIFFTYPGHIAEMMARAKEKA